MTLIWMTRDFSASNALALIACSRVGQKKDFPMMRFCVAALSASTRSTHFCNGDEFPANDNSAASSTSCADLCGGFTLLAQVWFYQFRWTDGSDCTAPRRTRREEEMDQ